MKTKFFAFVLIFQLFLFSPAAAVVILQENFEATFPPTGWSRVIHSGSCNWESTATTGRTNLTNGSGYAADADIDWCFNAMDVSLLTPAFSLAGTTNPVLRFQNYFNSHSFYDDDAYVDISVDGGTNWTTLLHYDGVDIGPNLVEIDLSAYVGQASVLIQFHYVAAEVYGWFWLVDDVVIEDPSTYTVTYDANGADSGTPPADQTKIHDADLTLATNSGSLTRAGYAFAGWNTAADGSGTHYDEGATYTDNAALTLYAEWTADTYPVTYDGNGADSGTPPADQTKIHDADLTLATNSGSLTRAAYTFAGWNTAADGSGTYYDEGATYTENAALTLYAEWTADTPASIPTLSEWGMILFVILMAGTAVVFMRRRKDMTA
ncbi:MAG TPA: IPTL-CTERM sorting domain-containing protein [Desulfobacteraceae bacterium]|nr:IPTL-CTERM sorting domain-containing protein [Desulfobacteraceae bacterium]HPQ28936.1 IPTL-CTERM sorting domain-containing protein [Desulfobacteraceae bacterium]